MKYSLGISNFLEEISSLSHSVVFRGYQTLPDAGRGWGQEEKGTTEDEMVGWHH